MKKYSEKQLEHPFEYLRKKNGEIFEPEIIANWYRARAFVLNEFSNLTFLPGDINHFHPIVMVDDDCGLMLSIVRQLALFAHFLNYEESCLNNNSRNRTVITLVTSDPDILEKMQKEEYLCNLPKYCCLSFHDDKPKNIDSYVDIEIEIFENCPDIIGDYEFLITADKVRAFCDSKDSEYIYCIDTRRAVWTERIYDLGAGIDNLPYEDIHNVERYAMALDIFQFREMKKKMTSLIPKNLSQNKVKEHLSSLFCSDCFDSRFKAMEQFCGNKQAMCVDSWKPFNNALCMSEHARWIAEKLIMGYRPLNEQERLYEECLFDREKSQYRKQLKSNSKDLVHIALCSLADLYRIDPDSLKYDSFLMLSIPTIIKNERL